MINKKIEYTKFDPVKNWKEQKEKLNSIKKKRKLKK